MTTLLSDTFTRSVSNAWTGGSFTWTLALGSTGNNPNDWDINGTKGTQTHTAANERHYSYADAGTPDHKVRTVVNLSAADVTGASASCFVLARMTDTSNYYTALIAWSTAEVVTVQLFKRVAGALTSIGSSVTVATLTAAATTQITAELYVKGDQLSVKAWVASDTEPSGWLIEETDTALTTGNLAGLASRRETGNTNLNLAFEFDSFTASEVGLTAVEQSVYPPRVLLTVTDLTLGDAVELYRVVAGERTLVRAGSDDSVSDAAFVRVDAELPFGVAVRYVAVVNGEDADEVGPTTYTLPGGKAVVSDAVAGTAAEVVILAWPEKNYDRQRTVFQVGGRNVVVSGDLAMFTGTIEFFVETTSSLDNLMSVLTTLTGNVAQLRQDGGYDEIDCYFAVLAVTKRRWSQDGSDQKRTVVLEVAETESWAPALEARGYTYQDLADAYDGLTYADLANDYATYLELAQADLS